MNIFRRLRLPAIATVVAAVFTHHPGIAAEDTAPPSLAPGTRFPSLALPTIGAMDAPLSIADFRGHRTVVHVFASW